MDKYHTPHKPIAINESMLNFVEEHGIYTANQILYGAPDKATMFVYGYVAKSIDYLFVDENNIWHVFHANRWKPVIGFLVKSFSDIAFSLENLKTAVDEVLESCEVNRETP